MSMKIRNCTICWKRAWFFGSCMEFFYFPCTFILFLILFASAPVSFSPSCWCWWRWLWSSSSSSSLACLLRFFHQVPGCLLLMFSCIWNHWCAWSCTHVHTHTHTHMCTCTHEDPLYPACHCCLNVFNLCLLHSFESVLLGSHGPEVSLNLVMAICHGR